MQEEWFPLVDEEGRVLGRVTRRQAHGDPSLLHPVVHCLILDAAGRLLLQLRSRNKDIQPGRWDTSVGGHVSEGETPEQAVLREIREELGVAADPGQLRFLYRYLMRSEVESELVTTYLWRSEGPFVAQPEEIDALRFWSFEEIRAALGGGALTPNFEDEFRRFLQVDRG